MTNAESAMYRYWGKARPELEVQGPQAHLLPYHCLDVAAVGVTYVKKAPAFRAFLMRSMGLASETALESWVGFWLSMHDLGKLAEAFQGQKRDLFRQLRGRLPDPSKTYRVRHDSLGMLLWQDALSTVAEQDGWFGSHTASIMTGMDCWMRAVTGHHGQPPDPTSGGDWMRHFDSREDLPAARAFANEMRTMFLGKSVVAELSPFLDGDSVLETSEEISWWIAGLTVLADWLGSNTDFFPYRSDPDNPRSLSQYWEESSERAISALQSSGVLPTPGSGCLGFADLFPGIAARSPLQQWTSTVEIAPGQQIYLLEDITGAGKTEAAIMLAHRLIASGCAEGFFIGLPTMATANAMYGRIAKVHDKLFDGFASFVLAQSQRRLVEEFVSSVIGSGPEDRDLEQADDTATARCKAWLADNNKRSLLAPAAVGTIDQALLAVLHSKHQCLRLLGLFNKVLIVDEVHACDSYMQRVLQTLLEFHARAGGTAILLSATMPQAMKQSLLAAFARGCQVAAPKLRRQDFPLATRWGPAAVSPLLEEELGARPDVRREVVVRYLSDDSEVVSGIEQALAAGRCVCWMRNTVSDALAAYAKFKERLAPENLLLFHARFALGERLDIERRILELFGKESGPRERNGRLVIATQVAEQSLDADWDLIVSDLAPIDRLIQRAGRLMRHPRDMNGARLAFGSADQRGQPCLWVLGPVYTDEPRSDWFKGMFPKASYVYEHHGQLWVTAKLLRNGCIRMPDDARQLIESVFGEETRIPEQLQANAIAAQGRGYSDSTVAQQNVVKLSRGYVREAIDWWNEARTPSRLGEPSVDVVLARWKGDRLYPWIEGPRDWAYSTVRVSARLIAERHPDPVPEREAMIAQTLLSLPNQGKWCVLLPLRETPQGWAGEARSAPRKGEGPIVRQWRYEKSCGLSEADTPDGLPEE